MMSRMAIFALLLAGCGLYVEPPTAGVYVRSPTVVVAPVPVARPRLVVIAPQARPIVALWPPAPNRTPTIEFIWLSLGEPTQTPRIEWRPDACQAAVADARANVVHQTLHAWHTVYGIDDPRHKRTDDWAVVEEISQQLETEK